MSIGPIISRAPHNPGKGAVESFFSLSLFFSFLTIWLFPLPGQVLRWATLHRERPSIHPCSLARSPQQPHAILLSWHARMRTRT
ncbi:hypothetical protein BS50DRAFT_573752, partial [Corynespora cassiicola Philippines]